MIKNIMKLIINLSNINLNMKILYILAQKQRNNGSHVSHTKKINHVHKKGSSFYKISNHCYNNAKPLGNKGQIPRVHEREPQGPRVASRNGSLFHLFYPFFDSR